MSRSVSRLLSPRAAHSRLRRGGSATLLLAALAAAAPAQTLIRTHSGEAAGDLFGYVVASAGDVNSDGHPDVIIGARDADPAGLGTAGSAYVYSGLDGSLIRKLNGDSAGDVFGVAVAGLGDLNADGFSDVAVGATFDDSSAISTDTVGSVRVFSGKTGSQLFKILGPQANDLFGGSVAPAGDWNADGVPDLVVGASNYQVDVFGTLLDGAGYAGVYSGVNGTLIKSFNGIAAGQNFGWSVDGGKDIDGDGFADIVVGSPFASTGVVAVGRAQVYSGKLKGLLFTVNGTQSFGSLGISVTMPGDVNHDGIQDIAAGAYGENANAGAVHVFHGPAGAAGLVLNGSTANDRFGYGLDGAGDVNEDGWADLVAGAYQGAGGKKGYARVFSGKTGGILYGTLAGEGVDDHFGGTVAGLGDADGDGWPDIAVGAYFNDGAGSDAGRAYIYDVLIHQASVGFGSGVPQLQAYGTPLSAGGHADLLLSAAAPGKPAALVASAILAPLPFKGGTIAPGLGTASIFNFTTSAAGTVLLTPVPGGGGPVDVYVQYLIHDLVTPPQGWAFSNCVKLHFLP